MKRTLWVIAWFIVAPVASAQYLGDSLAAAGFNVTEDQAVEALAALATRLHGAGTPEPPPEPTPLPEPPPEPDPDRPFPELPEMSGTGYSFPATGGRKPSPEDAADWKSAWRGVGTTIAAPPQGSESVDAQTQYFKGVFYRRQANGWVVIPAPAGARVKERPAPATTVTAGQRPYLYYNGTFFVWNSSAGAYEVVPAPAGAVVSAIPVSAARKDRGDSVVYEYGATRFVPVYRGTTLVYQVGG